MTINATKQKPLFLGFSLVLLGAFGFSAKAIIIKLAYASETHIDAITLMALRMVFSAPFFLLVSFWHNKKEATLPLTLRQWLLITLLGVMGYYLSSYLDFTGLQYIPAGLERVILFLYPTFVVLFSALFHQRKITMRVGLALVLSYLGMMLVFMEQLSMTAANLWLGSCLVLASAVIFACFTIGSGIMVHRIGSTRFTAYTMMVASAATLVHFACRHDFASISRMPASIYQLALVMAIFSTVLPAFFMNAGIRRIGAGPASILSTTGPVFTLLLAFLLLDEAVTLTQSAGTLFVLVGVYLVSRAKE